jgi:hypothetical protein
MLKNKLEQNLLLLVVLVVAAAEAEVVDHQVAAAVVLEQHHTVIHVPIEQQAEAKVSDVTYTRTLCTL